MITVSNIYIGLHVQRRTSTLAVLTFSDEVCPTSVGTIHGYLVAERFSDRLYLGQQAPFQGRIIRSDVAAEPALDTRFHAVCSGAYPTHLQGVVPD